MNSISPMTWDAKVEAADDDRDDIPSTRDHSEGRSILAATGIAMALMVVWTGMQIM